MAKKLFELIVVEGQLKTQAITTRNDLRDTFQKKRHLFEEKRKTFTPLAEGAVPIVEEVSDLQTGVMQELRWSTGLWTKALDTSLQVAEGNTLARANVTLDDGTDLLTDVPATALLELEKRAAELQELIAAAPTLDPAKGFTPAPDKGPEIFQARPVQKMRTQKIQKAIVKYPATVEHPAQTEMVSVDEPSGRLLEQEWSSLITPARKAEMLARVEELRRACKAALHRANAIELPVAVQNRECGKTIFGYVLGNGTAPAR